MTVQEILSDIELRLPNKFAVSNKIGWINSAVRKYWRWIPSTSLYTFNTTDDQAYYSYQTGMEPDRIQKLEVASSASSTSYSEYTFAGQKDALEGSRWLNEATTDGMMLRIYPTPSTTVEVKVFYEAQPAAVSQSSDTLGVSDEGIDLIKYNVMKVIAQAGSAPDIDMANNYDQEERDELKRIKMDYYKKKQRLPKQTKTYTNSFWKGF
jgi:hypothetical protein